MESQAAPELKFEIGHVLYIDIVGYSKLPIDEQSEQIQRLRQIVRASEQFRAAEAKGTLLRLPTGDGGALVFRESPEVPVKCAIETSKALRNYPELQVRMGIHSGPVQQVTDLNEQANIAGAGINMAQRVMDCADAGHILLSKRVADDLEQYARWRPLLHDLGTCQVKHGASIALVNLYSHEFGNREAPAKVKHPDGVEEPAPRAAPRKSVAVLPFENLSEDKANAYFADGIQEEVLTRLSQIGDLKVISRTSTQRFRNSSDAIPQIAKQLGVANVLEGSVRKAGDQVRVHVQLIDAENDAHLWAERYDRKLTDIFTVETDIASKIADALQAKLTGAERRAIASRPTENTEAHQLYLKGKYLFTNYYAPGYERVRNYFEQAIDLDPLYAPAYAGLSLYHSFGAANGILPPDESWPSAERAVQEALRLDDTLAEAYNCLAAVELYYRRDWPAAEQAFCKGINFDPNFADIPQHYALTLAIFGRNDEAVKQIERAAQLNPLSPGLSVNCGRLFFFLRDYDRASRGFANTLDLFPSYATAHEWFGDNLEKQGLESEAVTQWASALTLSGAREHAVLLERTYAASGFQAAIRALAEKQLEQLNERAAGGEYVPAMSYLVTCVRFGDKEQAFAWLAKAIDERNYFAFQIRINPILDPLRSDQRFEALMQKLPSPDRTD
jgi:adenylate cyclase